MLRVRLVMYRARILALGVFVAVGAACGGAERVPAGGDDPPHASRAVHPSPARPHGQAEHADVSVDEELRRVAAIHGGAGPWAVAGYRMGRYALRKLGLERLRNDLEVLHRSPREVQFSCIADGVSAATGASLGKLNLALEEADREHVETVYRRRSTGSSVVLRPTAAFAARFGDVPREKLTERGREVMQLRDEEIFEEDR